MVIIIVTFIVFCNVKVSLFFNFLIPLFIFSGFWWLICSSFFFTSFVFRRERTYGVGSQQASPFQLAVTVTVTEISSTFLLYRSKPNSLKSHSEQKLRITFLVHSARKCESIYYIRTCRSDTIAAKYFRRRFRENLYYHERVSRNLKCWGTLHYR